MRLLGFILLAALAGCSPREHIKAVQQKASFEADSALYRQYLMSDLPEARQALLKEAEYLGRAKGYAPMDQAFAVSLTFARLSALEHRAGNEDAAELAMVKARYWFLQHFELATTSEHNRPLKEIVGLSAPKRLLEMSEKIDKGNTDGKGPKYLQDLAKQVP